MDTINNSINPKIANIFWTEGNNTKYTPLERNKCIDLFYSVMANKDLAVVEINNKGLFDNIYKIVSSNENTLSCVSPNGIKMEFFIPNHLVPIMNEEKKIVGNRLGVLLKSDVEKIVKGKKPSKTNITFDLAVIKNKI